MAETRALSTLTPTYWDSDFSKEFFQTNPFSAYSGTGENNIIRMKEDLKSKRGNGITFEFVTNLNRGAITGRQPLRGHEDKLGEYGDRVYWDMRKKGIAMHEMDEDLAAIDLPDAARETLQTWAQEDVKYQVIERLGDVGANSDVPYDTSTAADRNAWVAANSDRVLFGATTANYSSTFATAAGNVDSTNDRFKRASVSMLKRIALMARPRITPIRVEAKSNRRYFVAFVHPLLFRDFVADSDDTFAKVSVIERNESIFLGGDREYDGVIVHEVDDMPVYANIGQGGTTNVSPVYLCGRECLGWAVKERYRARTQQDDYDQEHGFGVLAKWGMKKLVYSSSIGGSDTTVYGKQRGLVSGFFASVAD